MDSGETGKKRKRRVPKPLDSARLNDLALGYVARFATTAGKLRTYLERKLRERGWEGEEEAPLDELIERFVTRGYVDDAGYARGKADALLRRGYGARRISQALQQAGVSEDLRAAHAPGEYDARTAALALARRRRFGPFAREKQGTSEGSATARALHEKQLAAMVRAGHGFSIAREVLELTNEAAAEDWLDEAREEDS